MLVNNRVKIKLSAASLHGTSMSVSFLSNGGAAKGRDRWCLR